MRIHRRLFVWCNSSVFAVAVLVTAFLVLTACGKDGPTEPTEPPPPPPVATRIIVSPTSIALDAIGQTSQLTAQVFDQHNAPMGSAVVAWTSGDDAVATVSAAGQVTAVGNGSTVISARSEEASATANVTVMQTVYGIVVEPRAATLTAIGETVHLAATVLDRNEQPVGGAAVSWTSSDPGVATVDEEGLVTAVDIGDARITASSSGFTITVRVKVEIANQDRDTLIALYNALGGPNWTHSTHWLSDLPLGDWHGVEIDDEGSVTKLDLGFNNLSGRIPPEMGNLASLQELYLYDNAQLSCIIPPELGNLSNLREMNLELNALSGSIPLELGNLSEITYLSMMFNEALSGPLPDTFTRLENLETLILYSTGLCVPTDEAFQAWSEKVPVLEVGPCEAM